MANPYKTHWYNRKVSFWFSRDDDRPEGCNHDVECLRFTGTGSDKPPVRIYLGTEPRQYRATRVFVWSVLKTKDPSRDYEIYLMSDLAGIPREGWKTGFTNYRYLIPDLAGNSGRAIYNDVDQIYLSDPAQLFNLDMNDAGVLAISEKENSVMLIDCETMAPLWTRDAVQAGEKHDYFKGKVSDHHLFGLLAESWNSRDGAVPIEQTDCLHYTTLHTQPWKPFPHQLRYSDSPLGAVWHELEAEADAVGFMLFTNDAPSREGINLIEQYKLMHADGLEAAEANPDVPKPFQGGSLAKHMISIAKLAKGAETILDYGAGKAVTYEIAVDQSVDKPLRISKRWPGVTVHCYDPGHKPFADLPDDLFDGVISTDVVEHLAPYDVPWVLNQIFARAKKFVYIVAACYPARKVLPNGRNAHSIQQLPDWWHMQIALLARRYPDIHWTLVAETKGKAGRKQYIFDNSSPSPLK